MKIFAGLAALSVMLALNAPAMATQQPTDEELLAVMVSTLEKNLELVHQEMRSTKDMSRYKTLYERAEVVKGKIEQLRKYGGLPPVDIAMLCSREEPEFCR